jgi:hypothetical protein
VSRCRSPITVSGKDAGPRSPRVQLVAAARPDRRPSNSKPPSPARSPSTPGSNSPAETGNARWYAAAASWESQSTWKLSAALDAGVLAVVIVCIGLIQIVSWFMRPSADQPDGKPLAAVSSVQAASNPPAGALVETLRPAVAETDSAAQSLQTPQAQTQAQERPAPQIWDRANALGPNDLDAIRERQREAQERNQVAIHVATIDRMVDYPEYNKGTIESFARGWYEAKCPEPWGVLVLVAVEDREARIHFDEKWGKRADAYALRVMQDQMVPRFKLRNYGSSSSYDYSPSSFFSSSSSGSSSSGGWNGGGGGGGGGGASGSW